MNLPAWNIESEYPSLESPEFLMDERKVLELIEILQMTIGSLSLSSRDPAAALEEREVQVLQQILSFHGEAHELVSNLGVYVQCLESVDAQNEKAKSKSSELQILRSRLSQVFKPVQIFMSGCASATMETLLAPPNLQGSRFFWEQERTLRQRLLSESEEVLLAALEPSGFQAWSDLYFSLSGTMKVQLKDARGNESEVGLAQASGMTRSSLEAERKMAWLGIQQAWRNHQESAAAILNSLAGWRLETNKKRSSRQPMDHLTMPLFQNRLQAETLQALLTAVENNKTEIQKAMLLMAKMHGKSRLDPWDLLAPAPLPRASGPTDYEQALQLIRTAFGNVDASFGDFIDLMKRNSWLEARVLPNKANGAFCTGFVKSKTPRVFQTYLGSNQDISTLAHELGHAYHSWVIRDLPLLEQDYPMTLGETASIFAETVLIDEMYQTASSREQKLDFAWAEVEGAASLLLNIPARFEFESRFYEKRRERALNPKELCELMDQAWTKWYGPTLAQNDQMFWASKLHFSLADTSFYNFPYTFGYLFALNIYSRRKELGPAFWPKYNEILRDTGRMTAEALIQKHLGEDIRQPQFWQKSIDVVKEKIKNFESLLGKNERALEPEASVF